MAEARKTVLRSFLSANGGHAAVVEKYKLTPSQASYLSQLTTKDSVAPFGELSAKNWESRLRLPERSLVSPVAVMHSTNVSPGPEGITLVPLISSVQAGEWCEIIDNFQPGDAEDWLPCPERHGPHTFCLKVDGQSMSNPGSKPSYDEGDVIFVDPDKAAQSGDRVVVRLEGQKKATFKQYLEEDGRKLLKALNPDWKPRYIDINGEATVCGVVIGKWVKD